MAKFTQKQLTIIIVCICAVFIVMGIITVVAVTSEDNPLTGDDVENSDGISFHKKKGDKKNDFEFNIRSEGVDDEKADSMKVNKALENDPYEELNGLIGLEAVKEEVRSLANFVKVQKMREEKGYKNTKLSYHLVFTGSPGTGKTTVARIVARIYKDLGILKKGHLVETDRSGLIGQYVGQTAPRVNAICDSALNGVLFIDEAYAITQGESHNDYGAEAVATLLKRMEDDRDKLVVIVAGYTDEMKKFINANPGLQSRFNRYINFPDYSSEDLYKIYEMYLRKNEYSITREAINYLKQTLDYVVENKDRNFGNARYVRNLFEKTIQCQANRLSEDKNITNQELTEITLADVKAAYAGMKQ